MITVGETYFLEETAGNGIFKCLLCYPCLEVLELWTKQSHLKNPSEKDKTIRKIQEQKPIE